MSSYQREIVINETPERLFDYVTEQENLPVWSPQVVKSEVKTQTTPVGDLKGRF